MLHCRKKFNVDNDDGTSSKPKIRYGRVRYLDVILQTRRKRFLLACRSAVLVVEDVKVCTSET